MTSSKIVIFGTGDIAQLANYYFEHDSELTVEAFTVDKEFLNGESFEGKPVVAFDEVARLFPPHSYRMFIAMSYKNLNQARAEKWAQAKESGYSMASYISSKCSYISQFMPGDNCFILEDNTIQPYVRIGNNVTLWSGNHVGHHSIIDDHNFVSSHVVISGHCHIEPYCFLGVNATLHNNVTVKTRNIIGAGAVITRDTVANGVYIPPKSTLFGKDSDKVNL